MSLEAWGDEGDIGFDGYVTDERADEMVRDALDEYRAKHSWKPIDTAPKDGTSILVYIPAAIPMVCWFEKPKAAWVTNGYTILTFSPTHWMQLPEAPEKPSRDTENDGM